MWNKMIPPIFEMYYAVFYYKKKKQVKFPVPLKMKYDENFQNCFTHAHKSISLNKIMTLLHV